jgi:hypothetical protein
VILEANGSGRMRVFTRVEAAVFAAYAAVTAFMTWPAATLMTRIYGQKGDPLGVLWSCWWFKYTFVHHMPYDPMSWVAVPFGRHLSLYSRDPLTALTLRIFYLMTNETVAYNIFLLLCFFLAAVAMYYLARSLTGSQAAATVAGFAFAFSPYMLVQGKEHLGLLVTAWIPLFFYFMIRAWRERSLLWSILSLVSFGLMTLFNYHYGLVGAVMAVAFLITVYLLGKPWRPGPGESALKRSIPALLFVIALVAFIAAVIMRRASVGNDFVSIGLYSARPWDYFLPHAEARFLGWATGGFIRSHLHGGFLSESSLFLGYIPLGLAVYGLYGTLKRRVHTAPAAGEAATEPAQARRPPVEASRRIPVALAVTAVVCFICSMPATAKVFGLKLYFPSYFFHYIVPDVRAYARFGIGVMFCVALLAAYGVALLLRNKRLRDWAWLAAIVISLLILLEFAIVPPFYSLNTAKMTDYYKWLKARPAGTVATMYPLFYADDFSNYGYLFDQRNHEKKLVNGAEPDSQAEEIRQSALDITNPDTPRILKKLGARYVMVIPSLYRAGYHVNYIESSVFDPVKVPSSLRLVRRFADCYVYEDLARPAEITPLFTSGSFQPVVYPDGHAWHPGASNMVVNIVSTLKDTVTADVTFKTAATSKKGTVEYQLNGKGAGPDTLPVWPVTRTISSVAIKPGNNYMTIHSDSALSGVTEVPGATEVQVGIMVSDISVTPLP